MKHQQDCCLSTISAAPSVARPRPTCAVRGRPISAYSPKVVMLNSRLVAALCGQQGQETQWEGSSFGPHKT